MLLLMEVLLLELELLLIKVMMLFELELLCCEV